jgi:hypothetical protein
MYLSAKAGQRMGQLEMERLYIFYHETITEALQDKPENAPVHE